ncbi:uncharacterized protein NFIA_002710 [Aspergillus fischeri NRRL 181]|uniref:Uncharacterized protein n=1 Tax=Neosartorya fischeri (strain ATCC 1020 / DSM 3700 / CBS 544.65 / FGSC A1164 / JCM 1740 / NRRL 181 / WB 181) TaxID=331117 RepID=A1DJN0_NEOFI|nr:uncharacterized protein NFIA_002710 [Aspergillus fischeri NRRL 181]EAW16919.1 hypothetical protein NFIA_002710 [Aspergillus fischeri NRRL 181]KAG2019085.1 hypothetical protein GB937_005376 [Aspergillus fischeri]
MAALNISGNWVMDKTRSANLDAVLKLQGIRWITRKVIGTSTMTLKITQVSDTNGSTGEPVEWMTLEAALTGGLKGVPERRPLTWTEFEHDDTIFGPVVIRSHYVSEKRNSGGRVCPLVELQTKDAGCLVEAVVVGQDGEAAEATIEKAFIHDFVRSMDYGWTAEQIWTVEIVGEETYLTRRIVVVKGSSSESAIVFYKRD